MTALPFDPFVLVRDVVYLGASELLLRELGDRGKHARSAIGVAASRGAHP